MRAEIDQSGKVEHLNTHTVVSLANHVSGSVYLSAAEKIKLIKILRRSIFNRAELIYHLQNPVRENVGVCENGRSPKCVETPTVRSWVLHKIFAIIVAILKLGKKKKPSVIGLTTSFYAWGPLSSRFTLGILYKTCQYEAIK